MAQRYTKLVTVRVTPEQQEAFTKAKLSKKVRDMLDAEISKGLLETVNSPVPKDLTDEVQPRPKTIPQKKERMFIIGESVAAPVIPDESITPPPATIAQEAAVYQLKRKVPTVKDLDRSPLLNSEPRNLK